MFYRIRVFSLCIIMTSSISCKKNSTTIEVNKLSGDPGSCVSSAAGTYTKGVAFNGTQKVTVQIDVKRVPSNVSISTDNVNGVFFANNSLNLTFTSLGVQNIVIGGSGTPINSGTYTYTVTHARSLDPSDKSTCTFSLTFN